MGGLFHAIKVNGAHILDPPARRRKGSLFCRGIIDTPVHEPLIFFSLALLSPSVFALKDASSIDGVLARRNSGVQKTFSPLLRLNPSFSIHGPRFPPRSLHKIGAPKKSQILFHCSNRRIAFATLQRTRRTAECIGCAIR